MSRFEGPQGIVTNGLVLNLDAGDPDSYTRSQPPYVEVLVVAGGGGGGTGESNENGGGGGGGGAGGLIYNSAYQITNAAAITVTVGAGGAGGSNYNVNGSNGSNSVFGSLTAIGGGGGSGEQQSGGLNGGSGGGTGGDLSAGTEGQGTAGQGNPGGGIPNGRSGGGGGGAGAPGSNPTDRNGASGGIGRVFSISGTSTYYAGGGGGGGSTFFSGVRPTSGTGGQGGGGNSSGLVGGVDTPATSGTANTGGGGGADRAGLRVAGAGGSGIVIVRYPGLPAATGGTIAYLNGYTIHTFTTSGTFTPFLWNDVSGNGNNGTLVNGIGFNSYENGGFLTFDGSDDFVTIPGGTLNSGSTLEMWFKQTTNKQVELLKYGTGTIDTPGCHAVYYVPNTLRCLNFINGTRTFVLITHTINLGDSTWRQLLLSYTGNLTGGTASLYINGQLITSTSATSANSSFDGPGFSSNSSYAFPGNLSTLRVYSRGLSAAEVLQNYNAQKSRFGL
jgi:hypothetical protein